MSDIQAKLVYAWEDKHIGPFDNSVVEFNNIQSIINFIWESEQLIAPPILKELHKNNRKTLGRANRSNISFPKNRKIPTWIIIHELSHSLTSDIDGHSDQHGSLYVAFYMYLLNKYLNIYSSYLHFTAKLYNISYDKEFYPLFLEQNEWKPVHNILNTV